MAEHWGLRRAHSMADWTAEKRAERRVLSRAASSARLLVEHWADSWVLQRAARWAARTALLLAGPMAVQSGRLSGEKMAGWWDLRSVAPKALATVVRSVLLKAASWAVQKAD